MALADCFDGLTIATIARLRPVPASVPRTPTLPRRPIAAVRSSIGILSCLATGPAIFKDSFKSVRLTFDAVNAPTRTLATLFVFCASTSVALALDMIFPVSCSNSSIILSEVIPNPAIALVTMFAESAMDRLAAVASLATVGIEAMMSLALKPAIAMKFMPSPTAAAVCSVWLARSMAALDIREKFDSKSAPVPVVTVAALTSEASKSFATLVTARMPARDAVPITANPREMLLRCWLTPLSAPLISDSLAFLAFCSAISVRWLLRIIAMRNLMRAISFWWAIFASDCFFLTRAASAFAAFFLAAISSFAALMARATWSLCSFLFS